MCYGGTEILAASNLSTKAAMARKGIRVAEIARAIQRRVGSVRAKAWKLSPIVLKNSKIEGLRNLANVAH